VPPFPGIFVSTETGQVFTAMAHFCLETRSDIAPFFRIAYSPIANRCIATFIVDDSARVAHEGASATMKIAVLGLGYVGCTAVACISSQGHQVVGIDVGRSPIHEPGIDELLAKPMLQASFPP